MNDPETSGTLLGPTVAPPPGTAPAGPEEEVRLLIQQGLGDRYEIQRLLGRGGMGDVYLGVHRRIQKPVAVKVLNHHHRFNPEVVERFLQEARAASQIRHPNVVDITDFGDTPQGSVYFVMEYLPGDDLAKVIEREGRLSWARTKSILLQILAGLQAAHAQGIVHRDIKPENIHILRDEEGTETVKVLDFGIAKVTRPDNDDASHLTRTGSVMGTAHYMSPEQAQGLPTDARTDLYAVGVILFEALTGKPPFTGASALAVMTQHLQTAIPSVTSVGVSVPEGVDAIIQRATAKQLDQRYSSAAELVAAIRAVPDDAPLRSGVTGGAGGSRGSSRTLLVAGIAAAVVAAGGFFALQGGESPPPAASAPAAAAPALPTPAPAAAVAAAMEPCPEGMVLVPGGMFFMGTDAEHPALASARPPHKVELKPYCLARREETLGAYRACSATGTCQRAYRDAMWPQGSTAKDEWKESRDVHSKLCNENFAGRDDHPVNCVTWAQARDFCAQAGGRLPSEAEWEFAARGADGRVYPWGDAQPDEKHMNGCGTECSKWRESEGLAGGPTLYAADDGFPGTAPVGSFALGTTKWGIDDMVGNVFEWTADDFLPYATEGGAPLPEGEPKKVIRGGAFNSTMPQFADPALRFGQEPEAHTHGIGFRCAADPRTN